MLLRIISLFFWVKVTTAFVGQEPYSVRPNIRPRKSPKISFHSARQGKTGSEQTQLYASKTADVKALLAANRACVDSLASISADESELTRLRFALAFPSQAEAKRAFRESVTYRAGPGRRMVESAAKAVKESTAGGGWDNGPVRDAAPHAAAINQYITPKNILTLSTAEGDILYVIRASAINDRALMNRVSVKQMGDFFLYVKEVHNIIANERSEKSGRLCEVIFANDISGVRAIPDPRFSQALTASSQQYEKLYPSLAGPTMILNLPFVLQAFIGLIKPLFPKTVQDRLMFESAPVLARLRDLTPLTTSMNSRRSFLAEVKRLSR
eukprot:CAMPEP_0194283042 /NCGR_PEP_ID=MMETSP0169-20130528/24544_1 /TAXON_ID=218684 /ORGANISM="Corethron pennatum, Strain L29A3" /LENGTH=325 /DNA_ID=CAMNT_0039028559 /DNA_START=149 /DNA_END=1126 /DNA_ORIENTATION=+